MGVKATLPCPPLGGLNFDGMTELTEGDFWTGLTRLTGFGDGGEAAEGRQTQLRNFSKLTEGRGLILTILFVGNGQDGAAIGGPAGRGSAGANRVNRNRKGDEGDFQLNFDGITELTGGGFLDRINKINGIGDGGEAAEGRQTKLRNFSKLTEWGGSTTSADKCVTKCNLVTRGRGNEEWGRWRQ